MNSSWPKIPRSEQHLRRLRESADVSVSVLADAAGCSPGHLRRVETTTYQPSGALAFRLARALSGLLGREVATAEFFDPDRVSDAA
jgi:transcriptional regulator with XRE-family HTH domain